MGRTWHGGLLFQSEDYAQVAAMPLFAIGPAAPLPNDLVLPCNRNRHRWSDNGHHPFRVKMFDKNLVHALIGGKDLAAAQPS